MLRDIQEAFRRGVLDGDDAALDGLAVTGDLGAARRLGIHRNNCIGSLDSVLQAAYPVVCRLVNERFFRFAARAYLRAHPPTVPQLLRYGDRFANFLAGFKPVRALPYLPDVARLEWARHEAYFAGHADALDPAALAGIPPERYLELAFDLHPAVRLVTSRYPVDRIWEVNQPHHAEVERVDLTTGGVSLLVTRPAMTVRHRQLSKGDFALIERLRDDAPLVAATAAASEREPGFDLAAALAEHLIEGTFCGFQLP